jgi:hypothetical protein
MEVPVGSVCCRDLLVFCLVRKETRKHDVIKVPGQLR